MSLKNKAYKQGLEDGKSGWTKADAVDIAALVIEVPLLTNDDGSKSGDMIKSEKSIEASYAKGYWDGKKKDPLTKF